MAWSRKSTGAWRGAALALAILALTLKVVVPPGFMVADKGAPFPIALCTGHGPLVLDAGDTKAPKAPAHRMDPPCAGAGNVTPPAPSLVGHVAGPYIWTAAVLDAGPTTDVAPGRGLAAPPPPSRAPPARLS